MNAVVLLINLPVQVLWDQWDQRIIRVFVGYLDSMGRQVCHFTLLAFTSRCCCLGLMEQDLLSSGKCNQRLSVASMS